MLITLLLLTSAAAAVSLQYPLQDQLPLIARVDAPYSWHAGFHHFAHDPSSNDSASSYMTICVTPYAVPQLHVNVADQFYDANPSLSSVFFLHNESALGTQTRLRVPPKWSFSVGDLFYAALQADAITFNGVTPAFGNSAGPTTVPLALHASDQRGYSAASVKFDLIIAAKELSMSVASLPTINVTASTPFNFSLTSPDDFSGVQIDGQPVQPSDIVSLAIETSQAGNWLKYDSGGRTLSGNPPADLNGGPQDVTLPVILTTTINQTLHTNVSLAVVPSYFSTANLPPVLALPGHDLQFNLVQYFSNNTSVDGQRDDVNLTATFDPSSADSFFKFDGDSAQLTGGIPANFSSSAGTYYSHITVTFTAYSHVTHSTSHASVPISLSTTDYNKQHTGPGGLSANVRAKLLLGLKIAAGIVSGLFLLATVFACMRRYARVPDSAVLGEEGQRAWTEDEKKWYGIGIEVGGSKYLGPKGQQGYISEKGASSEARYGNLGVGLQRVLTRTISNPSSLPSMQSPGVMRKVEFMDKLRTTARIVSDKYKGVSDICKRTVVGHSPRPTISKPTLIMSSDNRVSAATGKPIDGLPISRVNPMDSHLRSHPDAIPFEDMDLSQYAPSGLTSMAGSPSSSTGERSIPRRRADFAPPRRKSVTVPPKARTSGDRTSDVSSLASGSSTRTHEAEAIVQTAARATSLRSASAPGTGRPRLVPFTSSNRVPVPKLPAELTGEDDMSIDDEPVQGSGTGGATTKRVVSQVAKVFRGDVERGGDELSVGIQYHSTGSIEQSPTGSFSLESSHHGHSTSQKIPIVPRMLARTGEHAGSLQKKPKALVARLISGKALPKFVKVELDGIATGMGARVEKRVVEFWGTPQAQDVGEVNVGIYERDGNKCVGRVILEVVGRS
ncbi:hypothetical protein B0H21DRAFT_768535 [Amylocystis lapponica]|nr:hypothetical protein B0H21DRAFT_768535 [Amylocystis lapponica]